MNEITKTFKNLRSKNEAGLIAYITAGDPDPSYTPTVVETLVNGGADIIELGIPFSDPIADGPTIQKATLRALKAGTDTKKVFKIVEKIKSTTNIPLILLTYFNPIFRFGLNKFFENAKTSGVDGIIVPDLPFEEAIEYKKLAQKYQIDTIFLSAPTTSPERLKQILNYTTGFLYLVSIFGVTGARKNIQNYTLSLIKKVKSITNGIIPLAVGFGISKPEQVKATILNGADAAIVGSRFVKIIQEYKKGEKMLEKLRTCVTLLKTATIKDDIATCHK